MHRLSMTVAGGGGKYATELVRGKGMFMIKLQSATSLFQFARNVEVI